jgi:glycosyltransferase involved in cell wall biosynthesis
VWHALHRLTVTAPRPATRREGVDEWTSPAPERALPAVLRAYRPAVVIVNSVHRRAWTTMREQLRRTATPSVLYVREAATLEHVPIPALPPDLVLANCEALQQRLLALGLGASCVPSVIDFDRCATTPAGEVVLLVNPIPSRGLAIGVALAEDNPELRFAFQVSWPLNRRDDRAVRESVDGVVNIELRPFEPRPAAVYRDARVLLVPYRVDQRPRVVAEAQYNGIPVLASDLPAHREAVGEGGRFVELDAPRSAWTATLRTMLDPDSATVLAEAARTHARRADVDPDRIAGRFEALMRDLVSDHGRAAVGSLPP